MRLSPIRRRPWIGNKLNKGYPLVARRLQTKTERQKTYGRAWKYARGIVEQHPGAFSRVEVRGMLLNAWYDAYRKALSDERRKQTE